MEYERFFFWERGNRLDGFLPSQLDFSFPPFLMPVLTDKIDFCNK